MRKLLLLIMVVSASTLPLGAANAQNLLINGGLELDPGDFGGADSVPPGWAMSEGGTPPHPPSLSTAEPGNFFHLLLEGEWHMWYQPYQASFYNDGGFAHLTQTVTATPGLAYTMTGWSLFELHYPGGVDNLNNPAIGPSLTDGPPSPTDSYFALEFLDAGQNLLSSSVEIELRAAGQMNDATWRQHVLSAIAPIGAASVRVRASMTGGIWNEGADPQSYFVDDFKLTATTPTLTADFDDDGDVDGNDYLRWQRSLGITSGATNGQGDADGNGAVNGLDLVEWKAQYGSPAVAAIGAVPEPTTAWLTTNSLALLRAVGRKARRDVGTCTRDASWRSRQLQVELDAA